MAGRADLLPEPYVSALTRLHDQVPPIPLEAVETVIRESYGQAPAELFERFDEQPIAAASLGQVHRARYAGRDVVVKVLRPGVEDLVARDVVVAARILALVERRWSNPHVRGLQAVVEEFSERIGEEMDFRKEAANAEAVRRNFAGNRRVAVPEVVGELTRQRVMVMQYMEGTKIDALGPLVAAGRIDSDRVVASIMELYIQMMLVDGLFHADPHPGNILVAADGTIVLLDFGMVVRVPGDTRWHLINTVFAAIRKDADGILAGFGALGIIEAGADLTQLRVLAQTLLGLAHTRTTANERIQLLADEVMATLYDFPVRLPREMVYFARAAALIEGLGIRYDERFNAVLFASPIALRMRARILASLGEDGRRLPEVDWAYAIGGLLGHVANIVTQAGRDILAMLATPPKAAGPGAKGLGPREQQRITARSA
jgi:predicted unusual protein kinase regulating ubiquinone biosynthesis (AarF/ABC1/UbiB family)